jgi:hypothetical protein
LSPEEESSTVLNIEDYNAIAVNKIGRAHTNNSSAGVIPLATTPIQLTEANRRNS